ncbi:ACT domain-containing protein [Alloscardovia omnicolens]|uniref:ACT domain-containing protein n=1 Tax=Alloscardovia omnicolens TaxID=419015 RepID=UPI003A6BCB7B
MAETSIGDIFPDMTGPEAPIISGIAHDSSEAMVTLRGIPDRPGRVTAVFTGLAEAGINIDIIVQALAAADPDHAVADISITFPESQLRKVEEFVDSHKEELGYKTADVNTQIGKISLVGVGMKTHSGITARFFQALSDESINVLMISTSEIRISAVVPLENLTTAVRSVHTAFGLDANTIEAVVYGGTGR